MKLLDARVRWNEKWANPPEFQLLVDKIPDAKEIPHIEHIGLYYGQEGGYVDYLYYDKPGEGYGGRKFVLKMVDGSYKEMIGPWSSGSYAVNGHGLHFKYKEARPEAEAVPCLNCSITSDPKVFERGHTFYSGNVTLTIAQEAAKMCECYLVMEVEMHKDQFFPASEWEQVEPETIYTIHPSMDPYRIVKPSQVKK